MFLGSRDSELRLGGRSSSSGSDSDSSADSNSPPEVRAKQVHRRELRASAYNRPIFDAGARREEKRLIEIIHTQISSAGLCDMETLTDLINDGAKKLGFDEIVFARSSQCVDFLQQRSFLFEKRVTDKFFRNTSFAHRTGMVNIVRFIQENSFDLHGCRIRDILEFVINESYMLFKVYESKEWKDQPWDDTYFFVHGKKPSEETVKKILEDYPDYFQITGNNDVFVGLKTLAFQISSLWDEGLLPPRPKATEVYYDKSRTSCHLTGIQQATTDYAKGEVLGSVYGGRHIYCLHSNLGLQDTTVGKYIPIGSRAFVYAHMTLGHRNDFNAVGVMPIQSGVEIDRQTMKELARTGISKQEILASESKSTPTPVELSEDAQAQRSDLRNMIATEQAQIDFLDKILEVGPLGESEIMEVAVSRPEIFPTALDAVEFILERPHLYKTENGQASPRTPFERNAYGTFFSFLHDNGKGGMELNKMTHLLKSGVAGELLRKYAMENRILELISSVSTFVGKIRYMNPQKTVYALKVAYDKNSNLLLPFYASNATHLALR